MQRMPTHRSQRNHGSALRDLRHTCAVLRQGKVVQVRELSSSSRFTPTGSAQEPAQLDDDATWLHVCRNPCAHSTQPSNNRHALIIVGQVRNSLRNSHGVCDGLEQRQPVHLCHATQPAPISKECFFCSKKRQCTACPNKAWASSSAPQRPCQLRGPGIPRDFGCDCANTHLYI